MAWDNVVQEEKNQSDVEYYKLKDGANVMRFLNNDAPLKVTEHYLPNANGGKGMSITCLGQNCPVCEDRKRRTANNEKQLYNKRTIYKANVLDRADGKVKILSKGFNVFGQIKTIMDEMEGDFGEVSNYDIKLMGTKVSTTDASYTPIALPPKPLTEDEKKLELFDLVEISKPISTQQCLDLMAGKLIEDVFKSEEDDDKKEETNLDVDFNK